MFCIWNTETIEQLRRLRFCIPAVELGELCFKLRSTHAILVGEVRLFIEGVLLVHDLHEAWVSHDDCTQDFNLVIGIVILL